jgi:hypothetical protein
MKRSLRSDVAMALTALWVVAFGSHLWLFESYFSIRPKRPRPDLGLVNALNNHGSYAYISDADLTGLSLLMAVFGIGVLLTVLTVPRTHTPNWMKQAGTSSVEWSVPRSRALLIFGSAFAIYLSIIVFAGHQIVDCVLSWGVVLRWA